MSEVLYLAIVNAIQESILKKEYNPGDMLDSEAVLMKKFNASRMTIRKSLSLLSNKGYIYSVPGKGCFVCEPETDLFQFRFNKYEDLGVNIDEVRLLDVSVVEGDAQVREKLQLRKPDDKILKAIRLLLSGGKNVAVEYIYFVYLPNKPVVETQLKFANHLEAVERQFAFGLRKEISLSYASAQSDTAAHLGCPVGQALLCLLESVIDDDAASVYSFTRFYIFPEYFTLAATTVREDSGFKKIF